MTTEAVMLAVDPFDGDVDAPERILRDKFQTAVTKTPTCTLCSRIIKLGERYRSIVFLSEGFHRHVYCRDCCLDMVDEADL